MEHVEKIWERVALLDDVARQDDDFLDELALGSGLGLRVDLVQRVDDRLLFVGRKGRFFARLAGHLGLRERHARAEREGYE